MLKCFPVICPVHSICHSDFYWPTPAWRLPKHFLLQTQPKWTHERSWSLPCPLGLHSENLPCLFSEAGSLKHAQTLLFWDQIKMLSHQARVSWFVFWFLQVAISRTNDLKHFQWKVQTVCYNEKKKTSKRRRGKQQQLFRQIIQWTTTSRNL